MKYQLISTKVEHYNDQFIIKEWDAEKYKKKDDLMGAMLTYVDNLLVSFEKRSLACELNDLQMAFSVKPEELEGTCFEYKTTIPLDFWNLILRVHKLEIRKS